ncbi:MAG: AI-2E family transporter [Planctomycetes bacterium]|nr:AI-2E family transporter [Planctomycetota bacterium]MCB9884614.1 AI-2E family transporter [Planctomycetota bacterium]
MSPATESPEKALPPPWDRIFSLATRTFVWALLIAVLYLLRPFFLLIFLTFVFAYIQAHGVDGLAHRIKNRPLRVVIVGLVFLGTLFATGFTLVPQVQEQAKVFLKNKDKYVADGDKELNKFLRQYPSLYEGLAKHQLGIPDAAVVKTETPTKPAVNPVKETAPDKPDGPVGPEAGTDPQKPPEKQLPDLHMVRDLVAGLGDSFTKNPIEFGQSVIGYASSFLLSLLFSFLIVLDLRKLSRGVHGLAGTRVGFIYNEVADNIAGFARVLGRALEAQLFIAVCNTILTAIGIWMMGLENLLVLSAIVFFFSFIPVVGTIISSTPICLVALQSGGVSSMLLAILLIVIIHSLETYVLNPQIYGHHMHMNPVLVLIVLTIFGKLFGVWGLILGIPIVNYVFRHAIRLPAERPVET